MKRILLTGGMLVLTGCISSQEAAAPSKAEQIKARYEEAAKAYVAAEEECTRQSFRTRVEKVRCVNEAESRIKRPLIPYPELLDVKLATRMAIAEKVDRAQMTEAEGVLEMSKAFAQIY